MGVVADRMAALTVTVASPDSNIRATVKAGKLHSVVFRPGTYRGYTEDALSGQFARLYTLAYAGHLRGMDKICEDNDMVVIRDPKGAHDAAEAAYIERTRDITVVGTGPRKLVRFKTTGMLDWQCRIAAGTVQEMSEREFISEVSLAFNDVLGKTHSVDMLLKDEYFGRVLDKDVREKLIAELSAT